MMLVLEGFLYTFVANSSFSTDIEMSKKGSMVVDASIVKIRMCCIKNLEEHISIFFGLKYSKYIVYVSSI